MKKPQMNAPKIIEKPVVKVPDVPKVQAPEIKAPELPKVEAP